MNLRRKRYVLMNSGVWKGHIRNISGNPVTLNNALGLQKLEVLGNSMQDGTPSPDNPVEVVGVGERTLNLFDVSQIANTTYISKNGNNLILNTYACQSLLNPESFLSMCGAKAGDTITVSRKFEVISGVKNTVSGRIAFRKKHDSEQLIFIEGTDKYRTTRIPDDFNNSNYGNALFYGANGQGELEAVMSEIQILKGEYTADTLPPYEPYGYKVPVCVEGRNLFDANGIVSNTDDTNLNIIEYENINCLSWIDNGAVHNQRNMQGYFKENTQYTFSFTGYSEKTISIFIYYTDGTYSSFSIACNGVWNHQIKASSYGKTIDYWRGADNYGKKVYIDLAQSQIIEGSYSAKTMPPYEPYKEPQTLNIYTPQILHGLGNVSDTVVLDFDNRRAELIKRYEYFKVNASDWAAGSDSYDGAITTNRYHSYTEVHKGNHISNDSKCNILPKYNGILWNIDEQGFTWNLFQLHLRINNSVLGITADNTREERTSKFKEYIQNNDIYVLGKLVTPITTDISNLQDWDNMPDISGTIILTADSTAKPNLNVSYYSTTKE